MRIVMFAALGLSLAACNPATTTGTAVGATTGALVAGPIGAVVGAGIGATTGAIAGSALPDADVESPGRCYVRDTAGAIVTRRDGRSVTQRC